jgi:hypothetical protein
MPVIFRHKGFKFFFYANEGNPREPIHAHIEKDNVEAKFWLFRMCTWHIMMVSALGYCGN